MNLGAITLSLSKKYNQLFREFIKCLFKIRLNFTDASNTPLFKTKSHPVFEESKALDFLNISLSWKKIMKVSFFFYMCQLHFFYILYV